MAIYHMHMSSGSSACATGSYITGIKITCERTTKTYNYGRAQRVVDVATHLPKAVPAEWSDPRVLVNAIDAYEDAHRSNAVQIKKIEVALPREMTLNQQKALTEDYCKQITKQGYACVCAIHTDAKNNNPHAHIMVVARPVNTRGEFVAAKTKKVYVLDENGNRVPQIDKATGQQKIGKRNEKLWQRKTVKSNWIGERDTLLELRKSWADECNKWLTPEEQIDHRSHEERGLRTCATIHEGYAARALEQRGGISARCEKNREIRALNDRILSLIAKVARQQERDERAQQRAEQRQEIVDSVKDTVGDVAKSIVSNTNKAKHAALDWWHRKAAPALVDAIKPTEQQETKDNRWDDYQDRKRSADINKQIDAITSDYSHKKYDSQEEQRWFAYAQEKELKPLYEERNRVQNSIKARQQEKNNLKLEELAGKIVRCYRNKDKDESLLHVLNKGNVGVYRDKENTLWLYMPRKWEGVQAVKAGKPFPTYDPARDYRVSCITLSLDHGLPMHVIQRLGKDLRAQEATQRTQTVKEQPTPTQEPQTPQRANTRDIEPIQQPAQPTPTQTRKPRIHDEKGRPLNPLELKKRANEIKEEHATQRLQEEHGYTLDEIMDECTKASELLERENAQNRTQTRSHSHSR